MSTQKNLASIFSERKDELVQRLAGLSLPKDSLEVQKIVSDYLNELFENNGTYRQSLTKSEDYILQAAMSLLTAQQSIATELSTEKIAFSYTDTSSVDTSSCQASAVLKKEQHPLVLGATAIGGAAGALVLGTWGAVFGAIAGTAVALYFNTQQVQPNKKVLPEVSKPAVEIFNHTINAEVFVGIVEKICESVDELIGTFRSQINRVVDKYESVEKPTLESDYLELLENVQSLLGAYAMDSSNENRMKRIEQRIQALSECLENYSLSSVVYNGENKDLFNFQPSANVISETMVLPAIMKDGKIIIKGKVFFKQ